jgi:6-pyruvoyltetrahydropterin/6-carboxytetrahydropterin synthase
MNAIYTLTTSTDFAASHIIPGHPGKCARLHGHNWKVEVSVVAKELDHLGMAIDFQYVKDAAKVTIEKVDHYHLNDLPFFAGISPTAENVAKWLFAQIAPVINSDSVKLQSVTLWETDRSRVCYSEGSQL